MALGGSCLTGRGGEGGGGGRIGYQTRVSEGVGGWFGLVPSSTVLSSSPRCVDSFHVRRDERCSGIRPGYGGGGEAVMMARSRRVHEEKTEDSARSSSDPHTIKPFCSHQGPLGTLLKTF